MDFLGIESFFNFQENDINLIRYLNIIYVFSSKLDNLNLARIHLYKFLSLRNIDLFYGFIKNLVFCPFQEFVILGWFLKVFKGHNPIERINKMNIKNQKVKLKSLIKNSVHLPVFNLIKSLNFIISNWSNVYGYLEFSFEICIQLDLYLNKLLWKWAKHRHPRRTNTWIYCKYWKYFFGKWKFFTFDFRISQTVFLNSHFVGYNEMFQLSSLVSVFDFLNVNKVRDICYKKFSQNIKGIYIFLWKKQSGICFICQKEFTFRDLLTVKICNVRYNDNFVKHFILLHDYCKYFI